MKVYIATNGASWDFNVFEQKVFSTLELAKNWINTQEYPEEYQIFEYEVDNPSFEVK